MPRWQRKLPLMNSKGLRRVRKKGPQFLGAILVRSAALAVQAVRAAIPSQGWISPIQWSLVKLSAKISIQLKKIIRTQPTRPKKNATSRSCATTVRNLSAIRGLNCSNRGAKCANAHQKTPAAILLVAFLVRRWRGRLGLRR
jgi:hypothetical protein